MVMGVVVGGKGVWVAIAVGVAVGGKGVFVAAGVGSMVAAGAGSVGGGVASGAQPSSRRANRHAVRGWIMRRIDILLDRFP